ncbi:MAG: DUF1614 domain-containing protein [Sulfolobaceae archaeon]|nr:DUF1614 domain-containing protein [Sulfolobaceae archaeon]
MKRIIFTKFLNEPFIIILYYIASIILFIITYTYITALFEYLRISQIVAFIFAFSISILSLVFSPINIVIKEIERKRILEIGKDQVIYIFGIPFYFPSIKIEQRSNTYIAINVGGALIPFIMSIILIESYFIYKYYYMIELIIIIVFVTLISKLFSKVIPSVGVAMHPIIPPLFSIFFSYIMFRSNILLLPLSTYISSTLGTIIGADLLNMKKIIDNNPLIISIGGMGTFDGIYISGLLSLLLSFLIVPLPTR